MDFDLELRPSGRDSRCPGRPLLSLAAGQGPTTPPAAPPAAADLSSPSPAALAPSVPVPLITVGKVFAPIPPGRPLVRPEAVEAARQLGLAPMLAAALAGSHSEMDEFWDVAALTDPMMAANIMQSAVLGRRRVFFVERGAAAALARGQRKLAPAARPGAWRGWARALNPIAALEGVCAALERGLTKETAAAAAAEAEAAVRQREPEVFRMKAVRDWKKKANAAAGGASGGEGGTTLLGPDFFGASDGLAGPVARANPSLAHVPVRVALSLLRGAPGKFLLLAGLRRRGGDRGGGGSDAGTPSAAALPDDFDGADSLDALQVHRIPGFELVLRTPGGAVRLSPAFLSESTLHRFWSQGTALYTAGVLLHRRMQRRALCQRLRVAAAMVAGGGGGGGGGAIGIASSQNDEEEGMDEPPEVQEFVQELARDLAGGEEGGGGGGAPASGLVRAGATLATGVLTLVGPVVESVGAAVDAAVVACGGGGLLLGFPRRPPAEAAPLAPLLRSMASFNASQAAAPSSKDASHALALSAVCMGVAAKLIGDEVGGAAPGSSVAGFAQLLKTVQALERGGVHPAALLDARGHWALAAALVAAAAAAARADALDAQVAAVLRSVLPSLEHNGFPGALPPGAAGADAADAVRRLVLHNGHFSLQAELDLGANFACMGVGQPVNPRHRARQNGGGPVAEAELGRGLLLIGDLGSVQGLRTPRGLSLDGVGVAVGVDDGRKYM